MTDQSRVVRETREISSLDELRRLIDEIPEGTIYSLQLEVIQTHEQDHGKSE